MKVSFNNGIFIVIGLIGLSVKTLKKNKTGQSVHGETMFIMLNSA